jgi:predicted ArsR family transcriptional regulator
MTGMSASPEPDLERLAVLAEPARRRLYLYVAPRSDAVGRDEAAAAVGISRALAAFHLDRLVEKGLLETEFRRLSGRSGPGAGRPAKLYRRARREVALTLPPRSYGLMASLFADALDAPADGEGDDAAGAAAAGPRERLRARAHDRGVEIGQAARDVAGPDAAAGTQADALCRVLADCGFEPREDAASIRLGNCPFQALAASHRALTCGTNLALLEGVLEGLGNHDLEASLDPQPGMCCVRFAKHAEAEHPDPEHADTEHAATIA